MNSNVAEAANQKSFIVVQLIHSDLRILFDSWVVFLPENNVVVVSFFRC